MTELKGDFLVYSLSKIPFLIRGGSLVELEANYAEYEPDVPLRHLLVGLSGRALYTPGFLNKHLQSFRADINQTVEEYFGLSSS